MYAAKCIEGGTKDTTKVELPASIKLVKDS